MKDTVCYRGIFYKKCNQVFYPYEKFKSFSRMPATEQHRFLAYSCPFSGSLFGFGHKAKVTVSDSRNIAVSF